jgi:glutamate-5-semialdehyde dehydrogenase
MNAAASAACQQDLTVPELMSRLGAQAKSASSAMARASAQARNQALRGLAGLLRAQQPALLAANAQDLGRAAAGGLSGPMLDRLKLSPARAASSWPPWPT